MGCALGQTALNYRQPPMPFGRTNGAALGQSSNDCNLFLKRKDVHGPNPRSFEVGPRGAGNCRLDAVKADNNIDISPSPNRIAWGADPRGLAQFTQTQFVIERRVETDWVLNRYIATAPLTTASLMSLMERIEERL